VGVGYPDYGFSVLQTKKLIQFIAGQKQACVSPSQQSAGHREED